MFTRWEVYRFTWERNVFEMFAPKGVEMNNPIVNSMVKNLHALHAYGDKPIQLSSRETILN